MAFESLLDQSNSQVQQVRQRFGIVGTAPALTAAIERALKVAPIDLSVLVIGESGTGKEFFPKIIHQYSARKHAKYIAVNCGAIPEGTIDSELFGHEKGSFTGAIGARKGYFEEADGGTIFLDEVAELPLTTQARLLRVLETGEFLKVGSSTVQKTNIRIVAATNVNLIKAVEAGKFREDLYYRLSTVQIIIPPLRDRGNDIILLARKFANSFAEKYRTPEIEFDNSAKDALLHYRWPGNVRQLKNIIEQIALFNAGQTITGSEVESYLPKYSASSVPILNSSASNESRYEREREGLFNLIFRLQKRVEELEGMLDSRNAPAQRTEVVEVTSGDNPTSSSPVVLGPMPLVSASHYDRGRRSSDPLSGINSVSAAARERENTMDVDYKEEPAFDGHNLEGLGSQGSNLSNVSAAGYGTSGSNPVSSSPSTSGASSATSATSPSAVSPGAQSTLEDTERETIRQALIRNGGKRRAAAQELNISERTLYRKIKEYGLEKA